MTREENAFDHVDQLAALLRQVDPKHDLGAGLLAERLLAGGVSLTGLTVQAICAELLKLAARDFNAGDSEAADMLSDTAQHIAGLYGVSLTLDLTQAAAAQPAEAAAPVFVPLGQTELELAPDSADRQRAATLLARLAALEAQAAPYRDQLKRAKLRLEVIGEQVKEASAELVELAERCGCEIEGATHKARWVKGRQVVKWDGQALSQIIDSSLGLLTLTHETVWHTDDAVLNALAQSGKLPAQALEARVITPGVSRFMVERVKP